MIRIALLTLLLSAGAAAPLAAHTRLERSSPAAGDTVRAQPYELRLVFSQAVAPRYTTLLLRAPDGSVIPTPALLPNESRREFVAMAPHLAAAGTYTVEWRTVSADGHAITGTFGFVYAPAGATAVHEHDPDSAAPAPAATDEHPHGHHVDQSLLPPALQPSSWQNTIARALQFAALIALIGLATFRALLFPRSAPPEARAALRAALRRFGAVALTLFLLTLPVRLWLQSAALHGPDLALERGLLGSLLLDLGWGRAWLAQLTAAAFAAIAVLTGFTPVLVLSAVALAFTPAFQGHAAAVENAPTLALAADGLHVLAAGAWIGALAVLLLAAIPALWRHAGSARAALLADIVHRFSPLALAAAATLAITGVTSGLLHVHAPHELVDTEYGRMLLVKLGTIGLVLGAGWYNWRRTRPRLGADAGVASLFSGATLELLFAGATLAATAALVALPTP